MRILDIGNNSPLKNINLYLKLDEAKELVSDLQRLIENYGNNEHSHINDIEYTHEITVVIYNEAFLEGFDERSKNLINKDS